MLYHLLDTGSAAPRYTLQLYAGTNTKRVQEEQREVCERTRGDNVYCLFLNLGI